MLLQAGALSLLELCCPLQCSRGLTPHKKSEVQNHISSSITTILVRGEKQCLPFFHHPSLLFVDSAQVQSRHKESHQENQQP